MRSNDEDVLTIRVESLVSLQLLIWNLHMARFYLPQENIFQKIWFKGPDNYKSGRKEIWIAYSTLFYWIFLYGGGTRIISFQ
jgi:hypothetical protein